MEDTIYKLITVNSDGTVADIIIDTDRELMNDFREAAELTGFTYIFERHTGNPYNNNILVEGYYFEGLYLPNGYKFKNYYSYRYKK